MTAGQAQHLQGDCRVSSEQALDRAPFWLRPGGTERRTDPVRQALHGRLNQLVGLLNGLPRFVHEARLKRAGPAAEGSSLKREA